MPDTRAVCAIHRAAQAVHGFDLVATAPRVTACNMADVPLGDGSVDAAIFCLALMGTDYGAFLRVAQ
jgi:ribosomal RNA-processing protein 8